MQKPKCFLSLLFDQECLSQRASSGRTYQKKRCDERWQTPNLERLRYFAAFHCDRRPAFGAALVAAAAAAAAAFAAGAAGAAAANARNRVFLLFVVLFGLKVRAGGWLRSALSARAASTLETNDAILERNFCDFLSGQQNSECSRTAFCFVFVASASTPTLHIAANFEATRLDAAF